MSLLLDTHYVYAPVSAGRPLDRRERAFFDAGAARFVISAVSIWEIGLKWRARHGSGARKGELDPRRALPALKKLNVDFLSLTPEHAAASLSIPLPHNDPFDQLLLVQAQCEGLHVLTKDQAMLAHPLAVPVP